MSDYNPLPTSASGLIDWLDETCPPRCIQKKETLEEAHRYAGRRELIEELKVWREADYEMALESSSNRTR